jgi:hypothetical protein
VDGVDGLDGVDVAVGTARFAIARVRHAGSAVSMGAG